MDYFISRQGQTHGPYPEDVLRVWFAQGHIDASVMACPVGGDQWQSVTELLSTADFRNGLSSKTESAAMSAATTGSGNAAATHCSSCGKPLEADARFCSECGAAAAQNSAWIKPTAAPDPVPEPPLEASIEIQSLSAFHNSSRQTRRNHGAKLGSALGIVIAVVCIIIIYIVVAPTNSIGQQPPNNGNAGNGEEAQTSGPNDGIDLESLKKQVIAKVAVQHNFNPDSVTSYDATVSKLPDHAGRPTYKVTGKFKTESDQPSNVQEAIRASVEGRICPLAPNTPQCQSAGIFKHTVNFDATVAVYQKLDGILSFNMESIAAIDNNLSDAELGKVKLEISQKNWTQAFSDVKPLAEGGNATAQAILGLLYSAGEGVSQNYTDAFLWFHKAASQGNAIGEEYVGTAFLYGQGVAKDYAQAMYWYKKAANQGNAGAENNIGYVFQEGMGVAKDYAQAMYWYKKSVAQNNANAQEGMGELYRDGLGVSKDYARALILFKQSAAGGCPEGEEAIGGMYEHGYGVPVDRAQAVSWYQKAALHGSPAAKADLSRLGIPTTENETN